MPPNEDGCFCRRCGYDLAGIGSGACPECGHYNGRQVVSVEVGA